MKGVIGLVSYGELLLSWTCAGRNTWSIALLYIRERYG